MAKFIVTLVVETDGEKPPTKGAVKAAITGTLADDCYAQMRIMGYDSPHLERLHCRVRSVDLD